MDKVINKKMTLVKEMICGVNYCKPPVLYPTLQSENNITSFTNGTIGKITTDPPLDLGKVLPTPIPATVYIYISLLDKLGKTGSLTFDRIRLFSQGYPIAGTQPQLKVAIYKLEDGASKFDSGTYGGNSNLVVQSTNTIFLDIDNNIVGGKFYDFIIDEQTLYAFEPSTEKQNYYFLGITATEHEAPIASTSFNEKNGIIIANDLIYFSDNTIITPIMGTPSTVILDDSGVPYYHLYKS